MQRWSRVGHLMLGPSTLRFRTKDRFTHESGCAPLRHLNVIIVATKLRQWSRTAECRGSPEEWPPRAYLSEAADNIRREQTVVITQFLGMNKPAAGVAVDCVRKLRELAGGDVAVRAVRYTANASVLFLVVVARENRKAIHSRLKAMFTRPASDVFEPTADRNSFNW